MNSMIIELNNGEKRAVHSDQAYVGLHVLVYEIEGESFFIAPVSVSGGENQEALIVETDTGEKVAVPILPFDSAKKAVDGFTGTTDVYQFVSYFVWDGLGSVYILPSPSKTLVDASYATYLTVQGFHNDEYVGEVSYQYEVSASSIPSGPPLEITSILDEGFNNLEFDITSEFGNASCIDLYIVQIV